jgi:hypothetical protein
MSVTSCSGAHILRGKRWTVTAPPTHRNTGQVVRPGAHTRTRMCALGIHTPDADARDSRSSWSRVRAPWCLAGDSSANSSWSTKTHTTKRGRMSHVMPSPMTPISDKPPYLLGVPNGQVRDGPQCLALDHTGSSAGDDAQRVVEDCMLQTSLLAQRVGKTSGS